MPIVAQNEAQASELTLDFEAELCSLALDVGPGRVRLQGAHLDLRLFIFKKFFAGKVLLAGLRRLPGDLLIPGRSLLSCIWYRLYVIHYLWYACWPGRPVGLDCCCYFILDRWSVFSLQTLRLFCGLSVDFIIFS